MLLGKEYSNATGCSPKEDAIVIDTIDPSRTFHKIFLFTETKRSDASSVADYYVKGIVKARRERGPVEELPASVGQDINNTLLGETIATAFPVMQVSTVSSTQIPTSAGLQEGIVITLSKTFTTANSAILGYAKLTGVIDRLSYSILDCKCQSPNTISSFRAWLGIMSSDQPF